jgi:hypothetical protein
MKGWGALGCAIVACGTAHPPAVSGLTATGGATGQSVPEARIGVPEPKLSVEGALGIREFLAVSQKDLPDRIRLRGFVVRGRGPDVALADLPLIQTEWAHLADVPPVQPELILYRYYVFELVRWDPDPEDPAGGFHYAAHAAAVAPPGPLAPTYPDGSWSVRDLLRRTDLKAGERVRVTATIVLVSSPCPPCPPRRRCSPCPPPVVTFHDDPSKPEAVISMSHERGPFPPKANFGKRDVFDFEIDPAVPGALRFLSHEPPAESTL